MSLTREEWYRVPMPLMRRYIAARDAVSAGVRDWHSDEELSLLLDAERAAIADAEAEIARQDDEAMRTRLRDLVRKCKDDGMTREQCLSLYLCGAGRPAKKGVGRLVPDAEMHEMNRLVDLAYPREEAVAE